MPIGTLYVDIPRQVFIPVQTILGTMQVLPTKDTVIKKGDFDVSINPALIGLSTPVKFYDLFRIDLSNRIGFGFLGPVAPEVLDFGIIFRYRNARLTDKPPTVIYRSSDFCVYHSLNLATIVTIPQTLKEIDDLLRAI